MHQCFIQIQQQSIFLFGGMVQVRRRTSLQKFDSPTCPIPFCQSTSIKLKQVIIQQIRGIALQKTILFTYELVQLSKLFGNQTHFLVQSFSDQAYVDFGIARQMFGDFQELMGFSQLMEGVLGEFGVDERVEVEKFFEELQEAMRVEAIAFIDDGFHNKYQYDPFMKNNIFDNKPIFLIFQAKLQFTQIAFLLKNIFLNTLNYRLGVLGFQQVFKNSKQMQHVALQLLQLQASEGFAKNRTINHLILESLQIEVRFFLKRNRKVTTPHSQPLPIVVSSQLVLPYQHIFSFAVSLTYRMVPFSQLLLWENSRVALVPFGLISLILLRHIPRRTDLSFSLSWSLQRMQPHWSFLFHLQHFIYQSHEQMQENPSQKVVTFFRINWTSISD